MKNTLLPGRQTLHTGNKVHALAPKPEPEHNRNEGSEFLHDAIRMRDISLYMTEKEIDAIPTSDLYDFSAE